MAMEHSNSYQNKLRRRSRRYSRMLLDETGINATNISRFLMVCNMGLVSGVERERIVALFSDFAIVQRVVMVPQKSYCFVQFSDEKSAERTFDAIHGKLTLPETNVPVYLLFIEEMPSEELSIDFAPEIEGLTIIGEFVSDNEEQRLLHFMRHEFEKSFLKHRSVKHFGYEFNYKTQNVNLNNGACDPIPSEFKFVIERIQTTDECRNWIPDQITVNKYLPGQGIPPHIDTHSCFDDFILSLSLGSDVVMDFRNEAQKLSSTTLRRKSLLIMRNESRYAWTHGITPRKQDVMKDDAGNLTVQKRDERISFTFRKLRESNRCNCVYRKFCDSQKTSKDFDFNVNDNQASELERLHVHEVYDEIANHFSETRHKPWPNVEIFVKSFPPGSTFVDVGCGNGKYFNLKDSILQIGCDRSHKLSEECRRRGYEALICNCLELPFRSEVADFCICIAVIHHLSTKERRLRAIEEMARILKRDGQALIYVWAKNQKRDEKSSSYIKQRKVRKKCVDQDDGESAEHSVRLASCVENEVSLPIHVNRTQFKHEDVLVPWKLNKNTSDEGDSEQQTFLRYYHVFEEGELENLCRCVESVEIVESYYDQGNWCVKFRKQ